VKPEHLLGYLARPEELGPFPVSSCSMVATAFAGIITRMLLTS
jgi:hypothetical protein